MASTSKHPGTTRWAGGPPRRPSEGCDARRADLGAASVDPQACPLLPPAPRPHPPRPAPSLAPCPRYDFHKTVANPQIAEFYHPSFLKNRRDMLCNIKRKSRRDGAEAKQVHIKTDFDAQPPVLYSFARLN